MAFDQLTKQVVDFQKISFNNWYNAVALLQQQAVSMVDIWLNQSVWMPEDGRQALQGWLRACEKEGERFKAYVDDGFAGVEKCITEAKTDEAKKTKKQTTQQGG